MNTLLTETTKQRGAKLHLETLRTLLTLGLAFGGLCLSSATASAGQRPITDFTLRQGAFFYVMGADGRVDCGLSHYRLPGEGDGYLPLPPVRVCWVFANQDLSTLLFVDYAGLANQWLEANGVSLGTTQDGSVTERPLADGRAEVTVTLHTRNALAWAADPSTGWFADAALLFGNRPPDVLAGAQPALADCTFQIKFINVAPGAPLPDLGQLNDCPEPGQEQLMLTIVARAEGPLHAQFGVPEGTPGFLQTRQNALLATYFRTSPNSRVALDGWPAEKIIIQPIGR